MHNSFMFSNFFSQELEAEMENVWKKQVHNFKQKYESLKLDRETLVDRGQDMIKAAEDTPITPTSPDFDCSSLSY